jgi:hypothetical protein
VTARYGWLAAIAGVSAFAPMAALAATAPSPDALKATLAPAPASTWTEVDVGTQDAFEGPLDAHKYLANAGVDDAAHLRGLTSNGFLAGYGRTWTTSGAVLVEVVLAFGDNGGANGYRGLAKIGDTSDSHYTGPIDTSAIANSYGANFGISGAKVSAVIFSKGNDLFGIDYISDGSVSPQDKALTQAKSQYDFAPAYTIAPSQQQQNQAATTASNLATLAGHATFVAFVVMVIVLVVVVVVRSRRRPTLAPAMVQISPDGNYWFDGTGWRDLATSAPPTAPRSPDGSLWWDGIKWRQVPRI